MKRSVVLLNLVLFVCLLTGCGNKVDKPTFIVAMDQKLTLEGEIDPRWEAFQSAWHTYKAS